MSQWPCNLAPINPGGRVMPMNRLQFQPGVSMPEFFSRYGTQAQGAAALESVHRQHAAPRVDGCQITRPLAHWMSQAEVRDESGGLKAFPILA